MSLSGSGSGSGSCASSSGCRSGRLSIGLVGLPTQVDENLSSVVACVLNCITACSRSSLSSVSISLFESQ